MRCLLQRQRYKHLALVNTRTFPFLVLLFYPPQTNQWKTLLYEIRGHTEYAHNHTLYSSHQPRFSVSISGRTVVLEHQCEDTFPALEKFCNVPSHVTIASSIQISVFIPVHRSQVCNLNEPLKTKLLYQCCRFSRNIAQVTPKIIYFYYQKIYL